MQTGKKKKKKKELAHNQNASALVWKIRDDHVALLSQQYTFELAKQPSIDLPGRKYQTYYLVYDGLLCSFFNLGASRGDVKCTLFTMRQDECKELKEAIYEAL